LKKHIKVVVLNVGGMVMEKALPEADQINYLPRVTQPVLMLNGGYDMYFPVGTSQEAMFRLLGTPRDQKKMLVYPSGDLVPANEFIRKHSHGSTPISGRPIEEAGMLALRHLVMTIGKEIWQPNLLRQ
jgi:hypothetical protein